MIVLWLSFAQADEDWNDASLRDLHHYARSASLDVRGHVPTADELLSLEHSGELSDNTLDDWLSSLAFGASLPPVGASHPRLARVPRVLKLPAPVC